MPTDQHPGHPSPGAWRHYKGGHYTVLLTARHSETEEWLVVYRAEADQSLWVRPLSLWAGTVDVGGTKVPRFVRL